MKYIKVISALLMLGVIDSAYLVVVHFSPATLYCPSVNAAIDCARVVQSQYSTVLGVPLAVMGLIWTIAALALFSRASKGKATVAANMWSILGLAGVIYSAVSMAMLSSICLYCSALDILIILSVLLRYVGR